MGYGIYNNKDYVPQQPNGVAGPSPHGKQYSAGGIDFSVPTMPLQPTQSGPGPLKYVHDASGPGDNAILRAYYGAGGEYYPDLFSDLGFPQPQTPQGIDGFLQVLNDPKSGLNQVFSGGGASGVADFIAKYPHTLEQFGITADEALAAINGMGGGQQSQVDPFFELAMSFLYPNGIPGQEQGSPPGSGVDPRRNPNYQPPATPPPDPLQQLLGGLGGIDPLLQQLLGGFNPQPQPAPPYFNQGLGKF